MSVTLTPGETTGLRAIHDAVGPVTLKPAARANVERSARIIAEAAAGDAPVYGVNTGFGKLASIRIAPGDTATLQRNLILSHCCGVGAETPAPITRLMMALKLLSLGRGASGVRWQVIALLEGMLSRGVTPVIPLQGSVGASGDLAPLAHMSAVMIGEGEARLPDHPTPLPGAEALAQAGLAPVTLGAKEGLALINGTQFSTAHALSALWQFETCLDESLVTGAMSTDAAMGSAAPFRPEIHALRGHPGQIAVAGRLRELMAGSEIRESHREGDERVQDPYCLRCQPQVAGAAMDIANTVSETLQREATAVTDNPLVLSDGSIVSGGNFHAEPVAFAADQLALAIAEAGSIAQRRIALLVDPALSHGLPAFLTPEPGLNSGFMIAEVTSAALMSENKHLAAPCSVDSTPTSANQEDHVSMAAHGAVRLHRMLVNLRAIIGIEALVAAQGIDLRAPLKTSTPLRQAIRRIRELSPALVHDRFLATDIERVAGLVQDRGLTAASEPSGARS